MSLDRRWFIAGSAALAAPLALPARVFAQEKVVRFTLAQDFTRIYTFVTSEYSQGQRDYFTLINDRGGISGYKIVADISDHANDLPRALEAYERGKREGAVLNDPFSTPVARALVPRALEDKINLITPYSGRSDAADGSAFPYVLPLSINYWTQIGLIIEQFKTIEKGSLKGKKIVFVHIDTPFGKEPLPILNVLAKKEGYELAAFPYAPPGNDQSAIWPQVRRARPDFVVFWGAGVSQTVSLTEAIRNGLPMERFSAGILLSESDMDVVGREAAKGVMKVEPCVSGREPKVIRDILTDVVGKGKGAGPENKVGTAYYNYGVQMAALMVEGVRKAAEKAPNGPVAGPWLNEGLRSITNFTAEGLLPPTTITKDDHQGGGMGRIARWDGTKFVPITDWFTANQDVVWEEIRRHSGEFKKTGK